MTIAATTMKAEDDKDLSGTQNEEYSANLAEVVYTVAPGLKAKVTCMTMIIRQVVNLSN